MSARRTRLVLLAALCAGGCAVGPNFHPPATPATAGYGPSGSSAPTASAEGPAGPAQRLVPGGDIPAQWWRLFRSPALNALVEQALRSNPDLAAAKAGLRVAMENVRAQQAAFLPAVGGNIAASRNQNPLQVSPYLSSGQLLYNLYQAQLNASWTLDVFGGNRRAVEALKAQQEAQRFELESTRLTLTTNVVAAAIEEASLRAQVEATREMARAGRETLEISRRQYALGDIGGADLAAEEAAQAQLEQSLPPLEKQLGQERDLLAALAGGLPGEAADSPFDLASFQLPVEVPLSLPSRLVRQRPDVLIAEANLHSASAQIGVAIANLLPDITLTADPGFVSTQIHRLFEPGNGFWSVGGGAAQPIFQGGSLLAKTRGARAAYDQAAAQYRSAVITAFQNVADVLQALRSDADLLAAAARAERAAGASLGIARRQLELGSISYLALLNAEQTSQQARLSLIQAQAARLSDTAALFQALGGGWWNRTD